MIRQRSDQPRSPFKSPSFVASAVFVGALVLLAIGMSLWILTKEEQQGDARPPVTASSSSPVKGCPAAWSSATDMSSVSEPVWEMVGTVAAPTLRAVGPARIEKDGYRSCFAPSPAGAVFAAANYVAIGSGLPELGAKLASTATAPGLGRDAATRGSVEGGASTDRAASIQIAAYQLTFGGTTADVTIVVRSTDGDYAAGTLAMKWVADDWKIVVDPTTGQMTSVRPIQNLGGFIPWGAH
jgi:hypothetical protein